MGLILDKIKALATKWKQRDEKIDAILDSTLLSMQTLAETMEIIQKDAREVNEILTTLKQRQDEFGAKIRQLDESISKARKGFWGRLIFGG